MTHFSEIEFLDLIQKDPIEFNKEQDLKRNQFKNENIDGKNQLFRILNSDEHHDLKSSRTVDYSLSSKEIETLKNDNILVKKSYKKTSFGRQLIELYNNNMPVMVTSDMMLYCLHRFYDDSLELQEVELVTKFINLIENLIITLYSIDYDSQISDLLSALEMYLFIPYKILSNEKCHNPKYNNFEDINIIVNKINLHQSINLKLFDIYFKIDGSVFKPRGHYTKNTILSNYFMAFTWFTSAIIKFNNMDNNYINSIIFASVFSKIASKCSQIIEIEEFVKEIIGEPEGYTCSTFIEKIESINDIPIESFALWIYLNGSKFVETLNLNKFYFSVIGKGSNFDNQLLEDLTDFKFEKNVGIDKKYPKIFEITYALFENEDSFDLQESKDYKYSNYLKILQQKYSNIPTNSLYSQEINLLKGLSQKINISPFNSKKWGYKQAQTQIGHYNELRHDNVLYLEEKYGCCCTCQYVDILIEPSIDFWKEYLILIDKMKLIFKNPKSVIILDNFTTIVNLFIKYLEYFLVNENVPENIKNKLKAIITENHGGSGATIYSGWYPGLFYKCSDCVIQKYEVSSYFTGVPDVRDDGGVIHLGNGDPQLLYLVSNNKIFMGPVYEVYEQKTKFGNRFNDSEWSKKYNTFGPLNFNIGDNEDQEKSLIKNYIVQVSTDGSALSEIPIQYRTLEICEKAIKTEDFDCVHEIPIEFMDYKMVLKIVTFNGQNICTIPEKFINEEICLAAVKSYPMSISNFPIDLITLEMCEIAVIENTLNYIPEKFKSRELYLKAVINLEYIIKDIPNNILDKKFCLDVVTENFKVMNYLNANFIKNLIFDLNFYNEAVKLNPMVMMDYGYDISKGGIYKRK